MLCLYDFVVSLSLGNGGALYVHIRSTLQYNALSFHWLPYVSPPAACKLKLLPLVVFIFLSTMSINGWPDFVLQISSSITHPKLQELSTNLSCISLSTHRCTVIAMNQSTAKFQGLGIVCVSIEVVCGYFHVQTMKTTSRASNTSRSQTL